jgi:hypothetical protein
MSGTNNRPDIDYGHASIAMGVFWHHDIHAIIGVRFVPPQPIPMDERAAVSVALVFEREE